MADFTDKLDNMAEAGIEILTVADLISKLAGLPPMMEVYGNAEQTAMFVNEVAVEQCQNHAPIVRLILNRFPKFQEADTRSYDEQLAAMRQRAMQMSANSERETKMPDVVE